MKYLIAGIALSVGLFAMAGTAVAQHHGGQHSYGYGNTHGPGSHQGYGNTHGGRNFPQSGYVTPGVGGYSIPAYGGYSQPSYDPRIYSRPPHSTPVYGGQNSHGHFGYGAHHDRHGHH
jgi:hypothetical protein